MLGVSWSLPASLVPPWCLAGCPISPILPPWCLPGCPNGPFLPPWSGFLVPPWCLPGASQAVQLVLSCLPGASQSVQLVLSASLVLPWCLPGCPLNPFLGAWCLPVRPIGPFLPPWCLLVPPRLSKWSFPASLVRIPGASLVPPWCLPGLAEPSPALAAYWSHPVLLLADYWNGYCQSAPNQMPTIISVISASIAPFWIIWPWDFPLDSTPCLDFNQAKCLCFNWLLPNCPQPKA